MDSDVDSTEAVSSVRQNAMDMEDNTETASSARRNAMDMEDNPEAAMAWLESIYRSQQQLQQQQQQHPEDISASTSEIGASSTSTSMIGGMSIALPFTSHPQMPVSSTPSTPTSPQDQTPDQAETDSQLLLPRPLAVKPLYKKRVVVPATAPDGIIRMAGHVAEMQKHLMMERQIKIWKAEAKGNIYDKSTELEHFPKPLIRTTPPQPSISKRRTPLPPRLKAIKEKTEKPPKIWAPSEKKERRLFLRTGRPSETRSLPQPVNREGPIEALLRHQQVHKSQLAALTKRPLPLKDLQTLVMAELDAEEQTLAEIGTMLHKEILKLQLEEGVLMKMLELSEEGALELDDLKTLRPRSRRMSKKKTKILEKTKTTNIQPLIPPIPNTTTPTNTDTQTVDEQLAHEQTVINIDEGENEDKGEKDVGDERDEEEEDEDEYEYEYEEEYEEGDGEEYEGGEEYDLDDEEEGEEEEPHRPIYSIPGESYESRPISVEDQASRGSLGRPLASGPQAYAARAAGKKQAGKGRKRAREQELDEDEYIYEMEFEEQQVDDGKDEEDEESEDEDMYSDSDEGLDEAENDEDEDKAREALQRMLAMYGADQL
ncbi:hypothetical protein BGZ51_003024 [Haplosporangium sp. Z 767]|nr:hypothetical protein BGZ51_003024 [Haplosporangium sp. Z 767]